MIRPGEVTAVKNGLLQITFCRPDACASCGACEGGKKETVLWLKGMAEIGDIAIIDLPEKTVLTASAIAYGIPLLGLLCGMIIGNVLFQGKDAALIGGAVAGILAGFAFVKITEKQRSSNPDWSPKIIEIKRKNNNGL